MYRSIFKINIMGILYKRKPDLICQSGLSANFTTIKVQRLNENTFLHVAFRTDTTANRTETRELERI